MAGRYPETGIWPNSRPDYLHAVHSCLTLTGSGPRAPTLSLFPCASQLEIAVDSGAGTAYTLRPLEFGLVVGVFSLDAARSRNGIAGPARREMLPGTSQPRVCAGGVLFRIGRLAWQTQCANPGFGEPAQELFCGCRSPEGILGYRWRTRVTERGARDVWTWIARTSASA